jgi:hypothetical protein
MRADLSLILVVAGLVPRLGRWKPEVPGFFRVRQHRQRLPHVANLQDSVTGRVHPVRTGYP